MSAPTIWKPYVRPMPEINLKIPPKCEWEDLPPGCQLRADWTVILFCDCSQLVCTDHLTLFKTTADYKVPPGATLPYDCPMCGRVRVMEIGRSYWEQLIKRVIPL